MNKRIKIIIIIISFLICAILGIQVSKVIAVTNNSFFYTNKQEISIGETLEMTLDISKIKYNEFEFKLSSNLDTSNIIINEDIILDNYNNDISINIDKSKKKLDKITFYYQVPEKSQIGTKIELVAQIIAVTEKETNQATDATKKLKSANSTNEASNLIENKINNKIAGKSEDDKNITKKDQTKKDDNADKDKQTSNKTEIEYEVVESKKLDVIIIEKKTKQ